MAMIMACLPVAWLTGLGLLFDIAGAVVLAWPLVEPEEWAAAADLKASAEQNQPPARMQILREGRCARWGLGLLIVGFALQLAGSLLSK